MPSADLEAALGRFTTVVLAKRLADVVGAKINATDDQKNQIRDMIHHELKMFGRLDMWTDICLFHEKFKLEYVDGPRALPKELADFRFDFMVEELNEYSLATHELRHHLDNELFDSAKVTRLLNDQFDALIDLIYVALGTAYLHGFRFPTGWGRVQAANMAKVRAEKKEDSKRGSTFDVVKPPGWQAPDHTDLVADHVHVPEKL